MPQVSQQIHFVDSQNFSEFLSDLSAKDLNLSYEYQKVKLSLPRFKVDTKTDITQIFKNLGIAAKGNNNSNDNEPMYSLNR